MKCITCMSASLKNTIRNFTDDTHTLKQINEIATCSLGEILELCGGKLGGKAGGRKRSAYQEFTSQCLRAKHLTKFDPTALQDCAKQWRQQKQS